MIFPNPAAIEIVGVDLDEVTETSDPLPVQTIYVTDVDWGKNAEGISMLCYTMVGSDDVHGMEVPALEQSGAFIVAPDGSIKIRDLDPYDAVTLAAAGVPQPVAAIRVAILQGGALAQELDAVVAPDNSVATLMLETGMGTYVRYGGDWQLLSPDSDSLEDMSLVAVGPGAVDIWDAGEASGSSVSVFDLPNSTSVDGADIIQEPQSTVAASALTAAGISLPEINRPEDLSLAVRFASAHPQARWYVVKRAHALGAADQVPAGWGGGVVLPFGTRAAV